MGGVTAPVAGSTACPACTASVSIRMHLLPSHANIIPRRRMPPGGNLRCREDTAQVGALIARQRYLARTRDPEIAEDHAVILAATRYDVIPLIGRVIHLHVEEV